MSQIWSKLQEKYFAYKYLLNGASMVEEGYKKSQGQPFVIPTPEKLNIMVSSQMHIQELDKAPKEWKQMNLQFVLKTHVVDGAPTAPEVVAVTFW